MSIEFVKKDKKTFKKQAPTALPLVLLALAGFLSLAPKSGLAYASGVICRSSESNALMEIRLKRCKRIVFSEHFI